MTHRLFYLVLAFALAHAAPAQAQWRSGRLAIDATPHNTLNFFYENMPVEFPFCAYGTEEKDGTIRITSVTFPFVFFADENYFQRGGCHGPGLLGYGHTHLSHSGCQISEIDEATFIREAEPYIFLVCRGKKRFYWWSRNRVEERVRQRAQGGGSP